MRLQSVARRARERKQSGRGDGLLRRGGSARRGAVLSAAALALSLASLPAPALAANAHASSRAVCPTAAGGHGRCYALVVTDRRGNPLASAAPSGLSPATIKGVYGFPAGSQAGAGQTIAIVDAYDDPSAESDLATFSSRYGLPSCTRANGCFTKVDQRGGESYPRKEQGWSLEISLDVQWAHAIAPAAKILLVEAESSSFENLMAAEDYAKAHAQYVSNSWGGAEFRGESSYDASFQQPGTSFFVAAGDSGTPAEYPSSSPDVISVGGTTLHFTGTPSAESFTGESGWSEGGGGCSVYETANPQQASFLQESAQASLYRERESCGGMRATPDVALDASPESGVAVYDSTKYYGQSGWFTVGGTSASTPMWAARSADAGALVNAEYVYGSSISFRDITAGDNGQACLEGFDLCSGRGSWTGGSALSAEPLSFAGEAQTLTAGQPSEPITVSVPAAPAGETLISLSSSSGAGEFATSTAGSWSASLQVSIPAGTTASQAFYYRDTTAGSPALTASAEGYASATQTETVKAAALASIAISPSSVEVSEGATAQLTAEGADAYGNPVEVADAAWTTTAPGTLSPEIGASTIFTAGLTPGSGLIGASVGSIQASVPVTVTEATIAAPTQLIASPQGKHMTLSWQGGGTGVTYNLYRGTEPGKEKLYAQGITETSAKDMAVESGVTYYYYVTAVTASGIESARSNEAFATAR